MRGALAVEGHGDVQTPRDLRLHLAAADGHHRIPNSGLSWEQLLELHDRDHRDRRP